MLRTSERATVASLRRVASVIRIAVWLRILLAVCLLSACGKPPPKFQSTDITGSSLTAEFEIPDQTGKPRRLSDFKGKVVAMFFGFTHCPDVCPTTLTELKAALAELGPAAAKEVQVLFVTVDPERDTQEVLASYTGAFDPSFLGLRGSPEELQALAKQMRVFYQRSEGKNGNYTMDHNAATFLFDREGRIRLLVSYGAGAKVFAHDIKRLLQER